MHHHTSRIIARYRLVLISFEMPACLRVTCMYTIENSVCVFSLGGARILSRVGNAMMFSHSCVMQIWLLRYIGYGNSTVFCRRITDCMMTERKIRVSKTPVYQSS